MELSPKRYTMRPKYGLEYLDHGLQSNLDKPGDSLTIKIDDYALSEDELKRAGTAAGYTVEKVDPEHLKFS